MDNALPSSIRLLCVGLNHKTAPLAVRETLAFSPSRVGEAVRAFREAFPSAEVVILSTCNRVEMYLARPVADAPNMAQLAEFLAQFHKLPAGDFLAHLYHYEDRGMIEHLFAVASSLDSMVVGETQILAQVKEAYAAAREAGAVGSTLHVLFQRAIAAAKAVHDQTELAAGHISIASVAVDLARSVFDRFDDKTVLCIGAGKMATLMLRHLAGLKPRQIVVTNRSAERAEAVAKSFGARVAPMELLEQSLTEADIVLTSTGSPHAIITATGFKGLLRARRYRPAVLVDIAVPRDVEAEVGKLNNVYLYNIDDLQQVAQANRGKRGQEIERSRALLGQHVEEFIAWYAARDVGPLVKALYAHSNGIAQGELEAFLAKHPDLTEAQRKDLERLVHRMIGKLLHTPVSTITTQSRASARPMLASALKKLFALPESGE